MAGKFQGISITGIDRDNTKIVNGLYRYRFMLSSVPDNEWQRAFHEFWKAKGFANSVGAASFLGNTAAVQIETNLGDASKTKAHTQEASDAANNKFIAFEKALDGLDSSKTM
jgi:hypothetical protein